MTTPTLKGFAAFVREQDADREINHANNWCGCAVGEYVGGDEDESFDFAFDVLRQKAPKIYSLLNMHTRPEIPTTYGQLQTALDEAGL